MYALAQERNYPQGVPPLKFAGQVVKDEDGKPVPRRGPFWFVTEDGHETWHTLDKAAAERQVELLNAVSSR